MSLPTKKSTVLAVQAEDFSTDDWRLMHCKCILDKRGQSFVLNNLRLSIAVLDL